jgi:hypothetical protein
VTLLRCAFALFLGVVDSVTARLPPPTRTEGLSMNPEPVVVRPDDSIIGTTSKEHQNG